MRTEIDSSFTERSLLNYEQEKWLEWRKYDAKISNIKTLTLLSHVLEMSGASLIATYTNSPSIYFGVPAIIAINSYILKALDDKATKYWEENWIEPFRTLREDPRQVIIDIKPEDVTYPRLKSKN